MLIRVDGLPSSEDLARMETEWLEWWRGAAADAVRRCRLRPGWQVLIWAGPSRLAQAQADGGPRYVGRIGRCSGRSGVGRESVS